MSAALQLPAVLANACAKPLCREDRSVPSETGQSHAIGPEVRQPPPPVSLAFYRNHTQSLLRRYLYASMQIGRAPSVLGEPVSRGWASSRPIRTFEDAVIFVLDIETCLKRLSSSDREIMVRIVLQEYTQAEVAALLGMSVRGVAYRLCHALDRLTELLLEAGLLVLPR